MRPKQEAAPSPPPASPPAGGATVDRRGKAEADRSAPEPVVAEKADDQTATTKDEAKVAPEEELFRQAQKEATVGRCATALSIAQKVQRMNGDFYRRRIVGDPTLESCNQQQQRKAKSVAPSKTAPANQELNAPADADRKSAK
jgi:hypothetical protein